MAPSESDNRLTKVAVVGAGGQVGKHITQALLRRNKLQVTALTRPNSSSASSIPSDVHAVVPIDYTTPSDALTSALSGHSALVLALNVTAPRSVHETLIRAAGAAKVSYIIPSDYSSDASVPAAEHENLIGDAQAETRKLIEDVGSAWIGIACGMWYEYSVAYGPDAFGLDFDKKEIVRLDTWDVKLETSTWHQVGEAVAKVLELPVRSEKADDLCVEKYKNGFVRVCSFRLSIREIFESVLRVTGEKQSDWKIVDQTARARYEEAVEKMKQGDMAAFVRALYARMMYSDVIGVLERGPGGLQNNVLGLQEEDVDQYTKTALQMVKDKYFEHHD